MQKSLDCAQLCYTVTPAGRTAAEFEQLQASENSADCKSVDAPARWTLATVPVAIVKIVTGPWRTIPCALVQSTGF